MEKKSIAIIANDMVIGGVEKALVEFSKVVDYNRYNVTLFLKSKKGPMLNKLDKRLIVLEFDNTGSKQYLLNCVVEGKITMFCLGIINRLMARKHKNTWQLNQWYSEKSMPLLDKRYDCVIAYHGSTPSVVASALYRISAKKRILWVHGTHKLPLALWDFFDQEYQKFDRIYCVSKATSEEFGNMFPMSSKKTMVFHNLIDRDEIVKKSESEVVNLKNISLVTVGRLAYEKGQDLVPRTMRLLLNRGYEIYWYLIGDGDFADEIKKRIVEEDVSDHVIMLGAKNNPYPYIKMCDIYVQTSRTEGWCLTTQEARVLQKPIVTTNLPVMQEQFINGKNGLIATDTTSEALFESICYLIERFDIRQSFIENLKVIEDVSHIELQDLYDFVES